MMRKAWIYLTLLALMGAPVSCNTRHPSSSSGYYEVSPPPPQDYDSSPMKPGPSAKPTQPFSPYTAEDYQRQGERYFNEEDYLRALDSFAKSHQLDSKDQVTLVKAGVALVKIGKGEVSRKVFNKVIELNGNSKEADVARQWLERFSNPIKIVILPNTPYDSTSKIVPTQRILNSFLAESKLYAILDNKSLVNINYSSEMSEICKNAYSSGVKILIKPFTRYEINSSSPYSKKKYEASCEVKLDIYKTKTGELIKTIKRSEKWVAPISKGKSNTFGKILGMLFVKLTMDVHATLL